MKNIILVITLLIVASFSMKAQSGVKKSDTLSIAMLSNPHGDSIQLRWAPVNYETWKLGIERGYTMVRFTTKRDGDKLSYDDKKASRIVVFEEKKPLSLEAWMPLVEKNDYHALAAAAVYDGMVGVPEVTSQYDFRGMYNQKLAEHNKFGFNLFAADQSYEVAKANGMAYVDKNVKPNEAYHYVINIDQNVDGLYFYDPGSVYVNLNAKKTLPSIEIQKAEFGDKRVGLTWDVRNKLEFFTGYDLEMSDNNGRDFKKINETPIVYNPGAKDDLFIYWTGDIPENNKKYTFRIRGKTFFGEYSTYSNEVSGKGQAKPLEAKAQVISIEESAEGGNLIEWYFEKALNDQIKGFNLYRSETKEGEYLKLNDKMIKAKERYYLDEMPLPKCFYKIVFVDQNDNASTSIPVLAQLRDTKPPSIPQNLVADLRKDTVHLSWDPVFEDDFRGYRVFWSNQKDGNFSQITNHPILETNFEFVITMKTLSREAYFKVLAEDFRGNFSPKSEVAIAVRPDVNPPSPPVIKALKGREKAIEIRYATSSSPDVAYHIVQRKNPTTQKWLNIVTDSILAPVKSFKDSSNLRNNISYQYQIVAVDHSGLSTASDPYSAKVIDKGIRSEIQQLKVELDKKAKSVHLYWSYANAENVKSFKIYRAKNDAKFTTYKVVASKDCVFEKQQDTALFTFNDERVNAGDMYRYKIIALHRDAGKSPFSEVVVMKVK